MSFLESIRRITTYKLANDDVYMGVLVQAGFAPGRKLEVRVMDECIVLTARAMEPTFEDTFRRVQRLSKRKQQQILEFIAMVERNKNTFR